MADHAADGDIFIYRGMRAPQHIINAIVDKSVEVIEDDAFAGCVNLVNVETHDGITKVGNRSFYRCKSLRSINLKSVMEIGEEAFYIYYGNVIYGNGNLEDVEFGDKLETIGINAFDGCERLQHIAIPLKRDLFPFDYMDQRYSQFDRCAQLVTVSLIGGVHKTVASLHMECWRIDIKEEIDRINQVLPTIPSRRQTTTIKQWMDSVIDKMDHYKAEHHRYVKDAMTLLELALWKAKLGDKKENCAESSTKKKAKIDAESARRQKRITSGADIVIKNVLPFLQFG